VSVLVKRMVKIG